MDRVLDVVTSGPLVSLPRIERLAWELATPPYRHEPRIRSQRCVAIQVTLAGSGWVWPHAGTGRAVGVGEALLFIGGEGPLAYGLGPSRSWEFAYANLLGDAALAVAREVIARHGHVVPFPATHPVVRGLLTRLPARGATEAVLDAATSARLAWDLLTALVDVPAADIEADLAQRSMAWMRARLAEDVGVAEAATAVGVSREHLTRLFSARLGCGPAAWLSRLRLEHAERLLRDPRLTVGEVALRCGFRSASHFCAAFRARMGSTPAAWRVR